MTECSLIYIAQWSSDLGGKICNWTGGLCDSVPVDRGLRVPWGVHSDLTSGWEEVGRLLWLQNIKNATPLTTKAVFPSSKSLWVQLISLTPCARGWLKWYCGQPAGCSAVWMGCRRCLCTCKWQQIFFDRKYNPAAWDHKGASKLHPTAGELFRAKEPRSNITMLFLTLLNWQL